jgi:hypothetical protein
VSVVDLHFYPKLELPGNLCRESTISNFYNNLASILGVDARLRACFTSTVEMLVSLSGCEHEIGVVKAVLGVVTAFFA